MTGPVEQCEEWPGYIAPNGYGRAHDGESVRSAARVVWEKEHGPLPPSATIHHCCENRRCVSLSHLVVMTQADHRAEHDRLRRERTLTNQEFADRVGCHFSMASRLRAGKRLPGVDLMRRISKAYRIPLSDLVDAHGKGAPAMGRLLRERIFEKRKAAA